MGSPCLHAQKILDWIRWEGQTTFSSRDCLRAHHRRFKRVTALLPVLELLIERNYLQLSPKPTALHRSSVFHVHPKLLEGGSRAKESKSGFFRELQK
jgi:hypothetical protein